jgi:hypothetical protein
VTSLHPIPFLACLIRIPSSLAASSHQKRPQGPCCFLANKRYRGTTPEGAICHYCTNRAKASVRFIQIGIRSVNLFGVLVGTAKLNFNYWPNENNCERHAGCHSIRGSSSEVQMCVCVCSAFLDSRAVIFVSHFHSFISLTPIYIFCLAQLLFYFLPIYLDRHCGLVV